MVVRRDAPGVQPGPVPSSFQYSATLGHVRVWIDDLDALKQLLEYDSPERNQVSMKFAGGLITEPEDLRRLTNAEFRAFEVASQYASIQLAPRSGAAWATSREVALAIENWAKPRRTRRFPYWWAGFYLLAEVVAATSAFTLAC